MIGLCRIACVNHFRVGGDDGDHDIRVRALADRVQRQSFEQRFDADIEKFDVEIVLDDILKRIEIPVVLNDVDRIVDIVLSVSEDDVSHAAAV